MQTKIHTVTKYDYSMFLHENARLELKKTKLILCICDGNVICDERQYAFKLARGQKKGGFIKVGSEIPDNGQKKGGVY